MKKINPYHPMYLLACVMAILLCSCVDKQYDMKELSDINTDVTFGGPEFAIPIGSTEQVKLSTFIEKTSIFIINERGEYVLSQSGNVSIEIPQINIPAFTPAVHATEPIVLDFLPNPPVAPSWARPTRTGTKVYATIPTQTIKVGNTMNNIPSDLVALRSIGLKNGGLITVAAKVKGLPNSIQNLQFENFHLTLPDYLKFASSSGLENNTLTLNQVKIDRVNGFSCQLQIEKLGFDELLKRSANGQIAIDGQATFSGGLSLPINEITSPMTEEVSIVISISFTPINAGKVSGIFNPQIKIDPMVINIDNLPKFFAEPDLVLDLQSLGVALSAENPLGVKLVCAMEITPNDDLGAPISGGIVKQGNMIINPKLENSSSATTTKIWLSNKEVGKPTGYEWISNPTLPYLIRKLPKTINFTMSATVDQSIESSIDLAAQPFRMDVSYGLSAPLTLGPDFLIGYTLPIEKLKAQLSQYLKHSTKVIIKAGVDNEIPLNFRIKAKAFDSDSLPIGVDIEITGGADNKGTIAAGTKEGKSAHTDVILAVSERTLGDLAKMDIITIDFSGATDQALDGAKLKADQLIKVKLSAKIPGGITINSNGN